MQTTEQRMQTISEVDAVVEELTEEIATAQDEAQENRDGAELLKLQGQLRGLANLQTRLWRRVKQAPPAND